MAGKAVEVTDLDKAIEECEFCEDSPFKMEGGYTVSYIKYDKKGNPEKDDHYEVFTDSLGVENHKNAEYRYKQLLESENTYTVNLSLIIDSSDYM